MDALKLGRCRALARLFAGVFVASAMRTAEAQPTRHDPEPAYPPRVLLVNFPAPHLQPSGGPADEVRIALERAAGGRLWVISRNDVVNFFVVGPIEDLPPTLTDVTQLAQQLRADALVLVGAPDTVGGAIRLAARVLHPPDTVSAGPSAVVWGRRLSAVARTLAEQLAADSGIVWRRPTGAIR